MGHIRSLGPCSRSSPKPRFREKPKFLKRKTIIARNSFEREHGLGRLTFQDVSHHILSILSQELWRLSLLSLNFFFSSVVPTIILTMVNSFTLFVSFRLAGSKKCHLHKGCAKKCNFGLEFLNHLLDFLKKFLTFLTFFYQTFFLYITSFTLENKPISYKVTCQVMTFFFLFL